MCNKGYKDKRKYDLYGKRIKDKRDANLHTDYESWDKMVQKFVFENNEGAKILVILNGGIAG